MALRRGPANSERLAVDMVSVTASGLEAVKTAPCFLYKVILTEAVGTANQYANVADATSSGTIQSFQIALGSGGAGDVRTKTLEFNPPLFMQKGIFCSSTAMVTGTLSF